MNPPNYPQDFSRWWREAGQFAGPASRVSDETVLDNLKEQSYYTWLDQQEILHEAQIEAELANDEAFRRGYETAAKGGTCATPP